MGIVPIFEFENVKKIGTFQFSREKKDNLELGW